MVEMNMSEQENALKKIMRLATEAEEAKKEVIRNYYQIPLIFRCFMKPLESFLTD